MNTNLNDVTLPELYNDIFTTVSGRPFEPNSILLCKTRKTFQKS